MHHSQPSRTFPAYGEWTSDATRVDPCIVSFSQAEEASFPVWSEDPLPEEDDKGHGDSPASETEGALEGSTHGSTANAVETEEGAAGKESKAEERRASSSQARRASEARLSTSSMASLLRRRSRATSRSGSAARSLASAASFPAPAPASSPASRGPQDPKHLEPDNGATRCVGAGLAPKTKNKKRQ